MQTTTMDNNKPVTTAETAPYPQDQNQDQDDIDSVDYYRDVIVINRPNSMTLISCDRFTKQLSNETLRDLSAK